MRHALIVDLYELTMAAGYFTNSYNPVVTFEMVVRELPAQRNYLIAAGLEQALNYVVNLRFDDAEIEYLKKQPMFANVSTAFFEYLREFRFSGDICAVSEGEIVFAQEPLIQVTAPLIEAQILETYLLATLNFQTMIASKAARVVSAAKIDGVNRSIMEFGSRRAHGPEASVLAARASYIGGCAGTSNTMAGYRFGVPVYGTSAHSWTLAYSEERESFRRYHDVFGEQSVFLIDTFNTLEGAQRAIDLGRKFSGVRIDSGDLEIEAKEVRNLLNENGYRDIKIILSGDLNEFKIKSLIQNDTPVDSFGVGTQITTSADAPNLPGVYKLVERRDDDTRIYRAKFSPDKMMLPGRKQVYRFTGDNGRISHDLIALGGNEAAENARPLLHQWIRGGVVVREADSLANIRAGVQERLARFEGEILNINMRYSHPVKISQDIKDLIVALKKSMAKAD
jgi:nicotinate phosphoribosyltransferase